ncbi:MAG: hypothetical protein KF746_21535, partial [Chitinophagaceae bacterium]|nr:hypothetical protein [Chitinophagaceae bacterium]
MTPDAATLGRFGSYTIGYYTGSANINVPIYTLKENSFSMDISLQYDHSGFIPNKEPGIVSLNWSLMAGGIITRVVNGAPDDKYDPSTPSLLNGHIGYIYGMINANLGTYSKEYVRKLDFLHFNPQQAPLMDIPYEYYPDVFSFNFNGHQGRFILGNDGKVKVISDQNYKVDLSNLAGQDDLCLCQNSEITITTDVGDSYTFGGDINTLEITFPYNPQTQAENSPEDRGINCKAGVINAWHLKKVKLTNGNEIIFNYEPQSRDPFLFADDIHGISSSVDYAYEKIYFSDRFEQHFDNGPQSSNSTGLNSRSLVKTCYLSNIISANGKIEFFYSVKPYSFYGTNHVVKNPNKPKQLDRIKITNLNRGLDKEILYSYTYLGNTTTGFRQTLSTIEFKDQASTTVNSYNFSYYKTEDLPDPLTRGIDIWGFYNGKNTNTSLIPVVSSGSPDYNIDLSPREVDPSVCDIGLLSKIRYPTGGWSEFLYESHDYNKALRRMLQAVIAPSWVVENGYVGGARIKEINHSSGQSQKYFYKKNYEPGKTGLLSSGVLVDHNVFFTELEFYYNSYWGNIKYQTISDNNIGIGSSYSESPISYSEVTEVNSPGYSKYYYSTHETNPDVYTLGGDSYLFTPDPDLSVNNFRYQLQRLMRYSSCDIERGKLLKTEIYNSDKQMIKEVINEYNKNANRYAESVIGFNAISPYAYTGFAVYHSNDFYCFQNNITRQTINEYTANANTFSTIENYDYISNSNPQVKEKTITNSRGQNISTEYKYPIDFQSNTSVPNVYDEMINRNMINVIVEEIKTNNSLSVQELLHVKNNFRLWDNNNLIKPCLIQKSLSGNPLETETTINSYDSKGNILQANGKDGLIHAYEWKYNS